MTFHRNEYIPISSPYHIPPYFSSPGSLIRLYPLPDTPFPYPLSPCLTIDENQVAIGEELCLLRLDQNGEMII